MKNGVTLRHPTIPVPQVPAQQPFPPANPIPMPTVSPSQNLIPGFLPVLNSYKPQQPQFFSNKIPQIPSLTSSIANPVNGFNFIDRRYRHVVRHPKSLSKRDNPDERAEGKNSAAEDDDKVRNQINIDFLFVIHFILFHFILSKFHFVTISFSIEFHCFKSSFHFRLICYKKKIYVDLNLN